MISAVPADAAHPAPEEKAADGCWAHLSPRQACRRAKRAEARARISSPLSRPAKQVALKRASAAIKAPLQTDLFTSSLPVTRPGWIALRKPRADQSTYLLRDLVPHPMELVDWDGSGTRPLVDANGRVFVVLGGMPRDHGSQSWDGVISGGTSAMRRCERKCRFSPSQLSHRRGNFAVLENGISFGGGQRVSRSFNWMLAYSEQIAIS